MPGCKGVVEQVVSVVDFARDSDVRQLNADLHCSGVKISVAGSLGEQVKTLGNYPLQAAIMYRTPIEVPLRIEICAIPCNSPSDWQLREVRYLSLPQAGPISMLPQNAGIMTKTRYINAFKDGMLVKYDSSRPSEAIRIAETPVRLIDSFFGGVSKVISLRTGRNDQEAKLSASDLALLQALERDQAIREAFDKCATEKRAAGETILACLPTKAD